MDIAITAPVSTVAAAEVTRLEASMRRLTTPCGSGQMVWREYGSGPTLALLHGGFGSWLHWMSNIAVLGEHYRLLVADLPGLGDSDEAPGPYDADSIAAIVVDGLQRLVAPEEDLHLAGFSFGGVVGGHVAAQIGSRATSLTLVGSGGMGLRRTLRRDMHSWRGLASGEEVLAVHRHNLHALMIEDTNRIDDLAVYIQWYNTVRARTRSAPISRLGTLLQTLPRVACPLAGIWGEADITAVGLLDERREFLRSVDTRAEFEVIPAAGHWVMYEAPEAFNSALLGVLDGFNAR